MQKVIALALTGVMAGLVGCTGNSSQCGEGTVQDEEGYCRPVNSSSSSSSSSSGAASNQGDLGGPCYANNTCNLGLECMGARCQPAADRSGQQGGPCYRNNTCDTGLKCEAATCVPDTGGSSSSSSSSGSAIPQGSEGGACYGNNSCDSGLYCVGSLCTSTAPTGELNGACYGNGTCNGTLECRNARCQTPLNSSSSSSGGTSSGSGSSSGGNMTAQQYFEAHVSAPLRTYCGACHESQRSGPDFMGTASTEYYAKVTGYAGGRFLRPNPSQNSDLVLKGLHAGPAFRTSANNGGPSDREMVVTWLEMEDAERHPAGSSSSSSGGASSSSGGVDGPALTASQAISWFGNCLSRADFDANAEGTQTPFNDVANQNSTEGRCYSCHATGAGGAYLSRNADDTYYFAKRTPYLLKLALPSQAQDGSYTMVASNRFRDHGSEPGTHPRYVLNAAREAAVNQLFARTLLRYENNTENCRAGGSSSGGP